MKVRKGTNRMVILVPIARIAIKFPVFHIKEAMRSIVFYGRDRETLRWYLFSPLKQPGGFRHLLFRGLVDNLQERRFYRKNRHPFVQPTSFSFFGLLNIQKMGKTLPKVSDFWEQMVGLTEGEVWQDGHHFENPNNFCLERARLRVLDYGGLATQDIIMKYGDAIISGLVLGEEEGDSTKNKNV